MMGRMILMMERMILVMIVLIKNLIHIHECLFCFGTYNIFVMMRNINNICYFVLEMFVIMENSSDVRFYI